MYKLRIITIDSPGLLNDAYIYKNIFEKYNFTVMICVIGKNMTFDMYDCNLFLETIKPHNIIFRAKVNLFMPNQELFLPSVKFIDKIDYVLCKTRVATDFFLSIKKSNNYKFRCVYTKFTTHIKNKLSSIEKDINLFVHLAGKSPFKNTQYLVLCWLKNNGFVDIDKNIKLYITCYGNCFTELIKNCELYLNVNLLENYQFEKIENGYRLNNLYIYNDKKNDMYTYLLTQNSLAICISDQEGYGHYINEARYYKSAILTVDHPPMNELVHDNINGITIKKLENSPKKTNEIYPNGYKLYKVYPDMDELRDKIIYCIKHKDELIKYGEKGRIMYIRDKRYFMKKMNLFIDYLKNIIKK
jgi:hypothetical protein